MDREQIYNSLKLKMEVAGFTFEKIQTPAHQNRKEKELKFVHPILTQKFRENGHKVRAEKFYLKPLSDDADCEIGLVNGLTSPLIKDSFFNAPNATDSFNEEPAWVNREGDDGLDKLLGLIGEYLKSQISLINL
jgi:hypothetical protein